MNEIMQFLSTNVGIATIAAILVLLVGIGVGVGVYKRRQQLPPAPPRTQIPGTDQVIPTEAAPSPAEDELQPPTVTEETAPQTQVEQPEETPAAPALEEPESRVGRMQRLRARLAGSGKLGATLVSILARGDLSEMDWEEIEDTLLMADLGLEATEEIMANMRTAVKVHGTADTQKVRELLEEELLKLVDPDMNRSLHLEGDPADPEHPAVVLMVGVNGTGKTTTVGKLARLLVAEGKTVLLGAADTFRAAAAEQLATWGERVGVETVRSQVEGRDPASVAFDSVKRGREAGVDVVLVDTAGRLQNKSALMDELGKVKRVIEKHGSVAETLLVLDATTGQNGIRQAEAFAEAVNITGVVLTKLDGSAKGGIVVSVQRALGVPVKLVGLGEGADDLAPFDPQDFVKALVR
ncbi:MAG: signal recognition particle-docking protein FtsY [Actinomycetaceae bacterium]|nr:signal recognition particle-docking protein FtsY [Actinomycetaceae bacterium]